MANLNAPENQGKKQAATQMNQGQQAPEDQKISQEEQSLSPEEQEKIRKRANARTEAEAQSIDGKAGQSGKSSENHMSHTQAGTHKHPGGGAKGHHNSR
jgi:hypothetical protein